MSKNIFEEATRAQLAEQEAETKRLREQEEEKRIKEIAEEQLRAKEELTRDIKPNTIMQTIESVKKNEIATVSLDINDMQFVDCFGRLVAPDEEMKSQLEYLASMSICDGNYVAKVFSYHNVDCLAIGKRDAHDDADDSLEKDIERIKVAIVRGDVVLPTMPTLLGPVKTSGYYMVKLIDVGMKYKGCPIPSIIIGRNAEECAADERQARIAAAEFNGRVRDVSTAKQLLEAGINVVDEYSKNEYRYCVTDDNKALALPGEQPNDLDGHCVADLNDINICEGTDQRLITEALRSRTPERYEDRDEEDDDDNECPLGFCCVEI